MRFVVLPSLRAVLALERGDDRMHGRLGLVIGERSLWRTEREAKRQTRAALRDAFSLIPVELDDRLQKFRCRRTDSATNGRSRQGFVDENRYVANDGRIFRERMRAQL